MNARQRRTLKRSRPKAGTEVMFRSGGLWRVGKVSRAQAVRTWPHLVRVEWGTDPMETFDWIPLGRLHPVHAEFHAQCAALSNAIADAFTRQIDGIERSLFITGARTANVSVRVPAEARDACDPAAIERDLLGAIRLAAAVTTPMLGGAV